MTVTVAQLAAYVGDDTGQYTDLLTDALAEGQAIVGRFNRVRDDMGGWRPSDAPEEIVDLAVKETSADLYYRRNAPGGVVNPQFQGIGDEGTPARTRLDPMTGCYRYLRRWVPPW